MITRRRALKTLGGTALWLGTSAITGCGSGSKGTNAVVPNGTSGTTRATGTLTLKIQWPMLTTTKSRVIPLAANAVRLTVRTYNVPFAPATSGSNETILADGFTKTITVARTADSAGRQTVTISGVPIGFTRIVGTALIVSPSAGSSQNEYVLAATQVTQNIVEGENAVLLSLLPIRQVDMDVTEQLPNSSPTSVLPRQDSFARKLYDIKQGATYNLVIEAVKTQDGLPLTLPNNTPFQLRVPPLSSDILEFVDVNGNPLPPDGFGNRVAVGNVVRLRATGTGYFPASNAAYVTLDINLPNDLVNNSPSFNEDGFNFTAQLTLLIQPPTFI